MASWQAKIARKVIGKILSDPSAPIEEQRAAMDRLAKLPRPRTATSEELTIAGVRCVRVTPTRSVSERHLIYLHGGGYVMGSPESHIGWVQGLGVRANATVTLVDYRLAPENPYPAAIDDCVDVVRALYETIAPGDIVIGGDSAGGGATLATLCRLRDAADPMPAGALLFSPWTDLTASGASVESRRDLDPMIKAEWLQPFAEHYAGSTPVADPGVSPLFADLTGLPRTLIQVGDHEVLLDDSVRLADAMRLAGVDVQLEVEPEMWHVFQALNMLPESKAALERAAQFVSAATRRQAIDIDLGATATTAETTDAPA